jgi:hypothetical protein
MVKQIFRAMVLLAYLTTTGCPLFVVGAAGIGVYTYVNGELKRSYQTDYDTMITICQEILESRNMKVVEKTPMSLTTTIKSSYYDDKPISIVIKRIELQITEVGVRSGYVGVWDRDFSERFHDSIAERLRQ